MRRESLARGVVLQDTGRILTALTPVREAHDLRVVYPDGRIDRARVVATDLAWGVALLEGTAGRWVEAAAAYGKAHGLARLIAAGVPTPPGFVIAPAVFTELVGALPDPTRADHGHALGALAEAARHAAPPAAIAAEVAARAAALGPRVAVRSSLRALMEATPPVRQATAALIGWTGRREMLRPLLLGLGDVDASVVEATGRAILQMGEPALGALLELVPTLDARSRGSVFRFFLRHNSAVSALPVALRERLAGLLLQGLSDKNPQTAAAAAAALPLHATPTQLAALRELAQQTGPAADLARSTLAKLSERPAAAAPSAQVPAGKKDA